MSEDPDPHAIRAKFFTAVGVGTFIMLDGKWLGVVLGTSLILGGDDGDSVIGSGVAHTNLLS